MEDNNQDKELSEWVETPDSSCLLSNNFPTLQSLAGVGEVWVITLPDPVTEAQSGETNSNRCMLLNAERQKIFLVHQEFDSEPKVYAQDKGYVMHLYDRCEQEVIRMTRPYKFCTGFCWCASINHCSVHIDVEAPVGQLIGTVKQSVSYWYPAFDVIGADGRKLFHIPISTDSTAVIRIYRVREHSASSAGTLSRDIRYPKITLTLPGDLDVKNKALLLGATFLIQLSRGLVRETPLWYFDD
ncbi:phospholipid scramblase 4-like isoform X2 [Clavelina lepadiformis]|uniref:phospholipid scramblase 4-like isoform X2 n=1 Tax=Clavelina lepadiformis TaxID=159417 RepID=UPI0040430118